MTKTAQIKDKASVFFKQNGKNSEIYKRFAYRLELMYKQGFEDEQELNFANHIDYVQYHYALYLLGRVKTLHRVFKEIDDFKNHEYFDEEIFWMVLGEIRFYLFENEMYESLELYDRSFDKIVNRAGLS